MQVSGITDDEKYLYELGYFIGQFSNLKALDVLPYHTMGETVFFGNGKKIDQKIHLHQGFPASYRDTAFCVKFLLYCILLRETPG